MALSLDVSYYFIKIVTRSGVVDYVLVGIICYFIRQ